MNTEEAREYFKPLIYENINMFAFSKLIEILKEHIRIRNAEELEKEEKTGKRNYIFKLDECLYYPPRKDGLFSAFIKVKVDNYSVRSGIDFNADGFIGFAGWADSHNTNLFVNSFVEWVDWLKKEIELPEVSGRVSCKVPHVTQPYSDRLVLDRIKKACEKSNKCLLKTEIVNILEREHV